MKLDGWAIDAGGRNWDAVTAFSKSCKGQHGLPACAFAGRSSHVFNPFVRSRLRDAIGRTVLCGDPAEHLKAGAGQKYVFFDADIYKESFQRAVLAEPGSPGSCTLYEGDADEHSEFARQVCNEKLLGVRHRQDGRNEYTWRTAEPHDYLDCMSMCWAVASSQGISAANVNHGLARRVKAKPRRRIRLV